MTPEQRLDAFIDRFAPEVALYPPHASLFFLQGAKLPDPTQRLRGSGTVVRHIVLDDLALFEEPGVRALLAMALARAEVPLDPKQRRALIIKSISAVSPAFPAADLPCPSPRRRPSRWTARVTPRASW